MKKQYIITPAEGKRLIAKALCSNSTVLEAASEHTLVIISGTTNGYVAEELLKKFDLGGIDRSTFFRGIFKGPESSGVSVPRDVIIRKGKLVEGVTIDDIEPELDLGDVILKGGNAVYLPKKQVGVVILNPKYGTLLPITKAALGRRVRVLMPVGLEKRVDTPIADLAEFVNDPDMPGTRFAFAPGTAYTELDALESCGVKAVLFGGGGVGGLEGSVLIGIEGEADCVERADALVRSVKGEPKF